MAEQFVTLEARLLARPEFHITSVRLEDETQITIDFEHHEQTVVDQAVPSGMVNAMGGLILKTYQVPLLGASKVVRPLQLLLGCEDFDFQPPTAELRRPDGSLLSAAQWPERARGGIIEGHRDYNRPVFCRRGLREYHHHVQHEDDPWDRHREGVSLAMIAADLMQELTQRWTGTHATAS